MEETGGGKHRIEVRRIIPAPREFVYAAWIDPAGMKEWMCPGDVISAEATLDVRVGGQFRITMRTKDQVHEHVGTYQIVERPAKLVFTWSGVDNPNEITLVTVEFLDRGNSCELVISHERFTNPDLAQRYEMGWGTIATKFSSYLTRNKHQQEKGTTMQEERNKQIIREFTRVFKNEHNVDGITHLFHKDFTHHFRIPLPPGLAGFQQVGRMMNGAFPDVVVTEEDLIASGDMVVERSSAAATHKGSFAGEAPTSKPIHWTEIHIYRLQDDKIREHWVELAMLELLQQIGALPQPAQAA